MVNATADIRLSVTMAEAPGKANWTAAFDAAKSRSDEVMRHLHVEAMDIARRAGNDPRAVARRYDELKARLCRTEYERAQRELMAVVEQGDLQAIAVASAYASHTAHLTAKLEAALGCWER